MTSDKRPTVITKMDSGNDQNPDLELLQLQDGGSLHDFRAHLPHQLHACRDTSQQWESWTCSVELEPCAKSGDAWIGVLPCRQFENDPAAVSRAGVLVQEPKSISPWLEISDCSSLSGPPTQTRQHTRRRCVRSSMPCLPWHTAFWAPSLRGERPQMTHGSYMWSVVQPSARPRPWNEELTCGEGAACRNQVVDQHHPLPPLDGILMHLCAELSHPDVRHSQKEGWLPNPPPAYRATGSDSLQVLTVLSGSVPSFKAGQLGPQRTPVSLCMRVCDGGKQGI